MLTGRMKAPRRNCRFSLMASTPAKTRGRLQAALAVSKPAHAGHDLGGKPAHFCFKRLELEHEQLYSGFAKIVDASSDLIVAADQAGRCASVASHPWGLRHG